MGSIYPMEKYNPLEEKRLAEFRTRLSDLELSERNLESAFLIRWLRARNLDVEKANKMLRLSLEWRETNNVDGILEREKIPEEFERIAPIGYTGLDKEGYPVFLFPMGRRCILEMLNKRGMETHLRVCTIFAEMMMDKLRLVSKERGRPVTQMAYILDMEGFSYRQLTSKLCRDFMIRMQTSWNDNYPEVLKYCLIINAPNSFQIVWNLMKPFMPKETLEKMDVYGVDKEKWRKVVRERFPLEGLPTHWGGLRQGEDEYCSKDVKLWFQGPVEGNFFNFNDPFLDANEIEEFAGLSTTTINARDTLRINLEVTSPNSSIAWRVRTENHDIGIQIMDEAGKELLAYRRIPSQQKQLPKNQVECPKVGVYTVIFDNSYSWARSKTIHYNVAVVVEGDDENGREIGNNN